MKSEKTGTMTDEAVSQLDKALSAAKARKATKRGDQKVAEPSGKQEPTAEKASTPKRPRLSDEEKAAREAAKAQERAARKAAREQARAEKRAAKSTAKSPAHMRKVERAAEKLAPLGQAALLLFNEATANLTAAELASLALHVQHFNRVKSTERALSTKLEAGQRVRIVGGDPRFIGKVGQVTKAQRIRCYVALEGTKKPIYLFTADCERAEEATEEAAAS
jgi:hypothetical protein